MLKKGIMMIASCGRGSVSNWFCVPPILLQFFSTLPGMLLFRGF
jgi:hypothetical protein